MEQTRCKLTIFFEDPFWVGIYERWEEGKISVCKITFGAEPKDGEVWLMILNSFSRLTFSPTLYAGQSHSKPLNPKRARRQARHELAGKWHGTKSQQALVQQRAEIKETRKALSRQKREAEKQRQFELRQEHKKAKHRGH